MKTVAVITDGVEQSIRLPQDCHLQAEEVLVKRVGCSLLLIPKDADRWQMFSQSLDEFTDDVSRLLSFSFSAFHRTLAPCSPLFPIQSGLGRIYIPTDFAALCAIKVS